VSANWLKMSTFCCGGSAASRLLSAVSLASRATSQSPQRCSTSSESGVVGFQVATQAGREQAGRQPLEAALLPLVADVDGGCPLPESFLPSAGLTRR